MKNKILKHLRETEILIVGNEKEFHNWMRKDYNAHDDEDIIKGIFEVVCNDIDCDYITRPFYGYNQISYYSQKLQKIIIIDCEVSFYNYTLDKIIETIKKYKIEMTEIEERIKL